MKPFEFYTPTKVFFGKGRTRETGKILKEYGFRKILLHYGSGSIKQNGIYDVLVDSLRAEGIEFVEAGGVEPNPKLGNVLKMIEVCRREKVEMILAVGGGSVIDSAKLTALGVPADCNPWLFSLKERVADRLPLFAVLTISATGSEMNGNSVITNTTERRKWSLRSPLLYPKVSVIDPSVQSSLPFQQTVNGALDAMAHILEYYFMDDKALATLAMNSALLRTIMDMTDRLRQDPADFVARGNLAWSATLALNGISGIGLKGGDWACHAIEHAFSALYPKIAHGEGLGVVFPAWIEYVSEKQPERFVPWAKNVWGADSVSHALRRFRDKIASWGSATNLRDLGIRESDLATLRDIILDTGGVGKIVKFSADEIDALLMLAF